MKPKKQRTLYPFEENGLTYCSGLDGERVCTGAQMGRSDEFPSRAFVGKLHLVHVRIESGGYDKGGAYWGLGTPLYCAFSVSPRVRVYVRARSRSCAKALIADILPNATFHFSRHD